MVRISITELKARLSEHLRRVKAGDEVIVTEHGRAVAVLSPVPPPESQAADLDVLVESGLARRAKRPLDEGFWALPRGDDPDATVLDSLLRERREAR